MATTLRTILISAIAFFALTLTGCSSADKANSVTETTTSTTEQTLGSNALDFEVNADSDSGKAGALQTVYFGFNSARLSGSARAALDANVAILKAVPAVQIQIEGHCDERGGEQYNLALGEKRALSIQDYLVSQGIDSSRISAISFGKSRPIAFGHDEEAWSQNRRGNFVITAK